MLGTLLKVGMGLAAGLALSPETRKKVGDAARGIAKDYGDVVRRETKDLERFWREDVEPLFEGEPPRGRDRHPPASA